MHRGERERNEKGFCRSVPELCALGRFPDLLEAARGRGFGVCALLPHRVLACREPDRRAALRQVGRGHARAARQAAPALYAGRGPLHQLQLGRVHLLRRLQPRAGRESGLLHKPHPGHTRGFHRVPRKAHGGTVGRGGAGGGGRGGADGHGGRVPAVGGAHRPLLRHLRRDKEKRPTSRATCPRS